MPDHRQKGNGQRRGGGPRPLAASLGALSKRALGRRGFAEAGLITGWDAIVGPELAAASRPDRLTFPPGRRDGGTLRLTVAGPVATELQHLQPVVIERINGYFGYRAVERIVLVNGTVRPATRRAGSESAGPARTADPAALARLETGLEEVEDPDIRAALQRLGRAVLSGNDS